MNEITQKGITALKGGDRAAARALLAQAVEQDPNDAVAWLWLSGAVEDDAERVQCLQQVLRIDPSNASAARGLAALAAKHIPPVGQPAPAAVPPEIELPTEPGEALPAEASPAAVSALETAGSSGAQGSDAAPSADIPETTVSDAAPFADIPETTVADAAPGLPGIEVPPSQRKRRRGGAARADDEAAQVIFRTRPSLVAALIGFWVFLAGAVITGMLLRGVPVLSIALPVGLFIVLEAIVLYAVIRNLAVRYELTTQVLTLRFRGRRQRVPVADIFRAEYQQTFFQRLLGAGDVIVDAAVNGEMARLRMRNIARCKLRVEQIEKVIKDLAGA